MKHTNFKLNHLFITMIISLVISSCNEDKKTEQQSKANIEENKNVNTIAPLKKDGGLPEEKKNFDTIVPTKYNDGRLSEVRIFNAYNAYKDTAIEKKGDIIKLEIVVVEWNKYEAIVSDENSAFGQLETNTMRGGDVASNKKVSKSSTLFFKQSKKIFEEKINTLLKVNEIPNRNVDSVSFDFVTNKGVYTIQESKKTLESGSSDLSKIFKDAKSLNLEVEKADKR